MCKIVMLRYGLHSYDAYLPLNSLLGPLGHCSCMVASQAFEEEQDPLCTRPDAVLRTNGEEYPGRGLAACSCGTCVNSRKHRGVFSWVMYIAGTPLRGQAPHREFSVALI